MKECFCERKFTKIKKKRNSRKVFLSCNKCGLKVVKNSNFSMKR